MQCKITQLKFKLHFSYGSLSCKRQYMSDFTNVIVETIRKYLNESSLKTYCHTLIKLKGFIVICKKCNVFLLSIMVIGVGVLQLSLLRRTRHVSVESDTKDIKYSPLICNLVGRQISKWNIIIIQLRLVIFRILSVKIFH